MRDIAIPFILYAGRQNKRLHLWLTVALLSALLLHGALFYSLYYLGMHPLFLFLPKKEMQPDTMQYVLVDDDLINEPTEEKPQIQGRVSRKSRDTEVDPALKQNGPQSAEKSRTTDFKSGQLLPASAAAAPSAAAQQSQPTRPAQPVQAQQPAPQTQPQQQTIARTPTEPKTPEEKPLPPDLEKPQPLDKTADLAPELAEDLAKLEAPSLPKKAQGVDGMVAQKPQNKPDARETLKKNENKTTEIKPQPLSKTTEPVKEPGKIPEPVKQSEQPQEKPAIAKPAQPQRQPTPAQPQQEPLPALPASAQSMNIPVRHIGDKPRTQGSRLGERSNTSAAMTAGFKSMAVLSTKYGAYMDMILKRIQEAILVQQQLSPMMFNQGAVVMTFSINPGGRLDSIRFIEARPNDLTSESAAARRVLEDVASGEPFPPPTPQMLADPDFQKITINFLFDLR